MPYKVRKPVFTLFKGYFDDSGNDDIFTLSCVFAKVSNWGFFISDWLEVIERKNRSLREQGRKELSRFHAADCSSYVEEFIGWNENERRPFIAELLKVFERPANAINSIGYSIRLKNLVEDLPETAPDPRGFAYALLLRVVMEELGKSMDEANHGDISPIKLPLIHERCVYDAVLLRSFNDLIGDPSFKYSTLFPSLIPMGWEDCPFLQPADFMAYENFKEDERHITGRQRRYPLLKLLSGDAFGGKAGCFDEEGMGRLKRGITEELKQQLLLEANIRSKRAAETGV